MKKQTLTANYLSTICWFDDHIIDWGSAGRQYYVDGKIKKLAVDSYAFGDSAIISSDGIYVFIYKRLATKGLLLKNGELIREVNRSYYCSGSYEYPAAFITINGVNYLVHCPQKYCRIDFENVETGELITDIPGRDPSNVFHSRLVASADGTFLISRGWNWHPNERVDVFKIADCIENPLLLDNSTLKPHIRAEINTASFIDNTTVLIGTSDEAWDEEELPKAPTKHIAKWNLLTDEITDIVKVAGDFGNLFPIDQNFAWDTYKYPKIIDLNTGLIVDKDESFDSGKQCSSMGATRYPQIVYNPNTRQLAISGHEQFTIFTP